MKYITYLFFFLLLSCKQEASKIAEDNIISIVHESNGIADDITANYSIRDKRYKHPGRHKLGMTSDEVSTIKKKIIEEDIDKLDSNLTFIKSCKTVCLSEITIKYKSGKTQHFIFDNYQYRSHINDRSYQKIANLEEVISNIIMKKKIDPQPLNVYL
jgi:hypothetical protein